MKYIKLFEDLNQDGYELISEDVFRSSKPYKVSEYIRFTDSEVNTLIPYGFSDKYEGYIKSHQDTVTSFGHIETNYKSKVMRVSDDSRTIYLYKGDDEWFFVLVTFEDEDFEKYYKCDQMYGLINFIENECGLKLK